MKLKFLLLALLSCLINISFSQTQTVNFNYTGSVQNWIVPPCVTSINVVVAGAKGGGNTGGNGSRITATLNVTPGQTLNIYVGGMGTCGNNSGGWNGGGTGFASNPANANYNSCGGGGSTDIRIGGTALGNRVIVAGGGGGKSGGSNSVSGGSANCVNGSPGTNTYGGGGGGYYGGGAGGNGSAVRGNDGQNGYGGGGGGSGHQDVLPNSTLGGSGTVIIRYQL
jgi:hypothetical protein